MKKIILSLLVYFLNTGFSQAQSFNFQLSSNQQLIETAVKDGFFIIRQSYQLKNVSVNPPAYYGWNGQPHFGTVYSLGIKTANGFYTDDKAWRPWAYDSNYEQYRADASYVPVISETNVRPPDSAAYTSLSFSSESCKPGPDSLFVAVRNNGFGGTGFATDNENGKKNGWIVWAVADKPLASSDTIPVTFLIYRTELTFEAGKNAYEVNPPNITNKEIAGGVYVVPDVTDVGQITFRLAGLLSRAGNQWKVVRPEGQSATGTAGTAAPAPAGKGGLTPAGKSGLTPAGQPGAKEKKK
jgi:hypothetical protein